MKSVVEVEIEAPQQKVAALFADPGNSARWMEDLASYEPLGGEPGMPGSIYRLVPKEGKPFVATVVSRDLPREHQLYLDAPDVAVSIKGSFKALSPQRTRLTSEEEFDFKSLPGRLAGFFATGKIKKVHRRQMEAFRRFAERTGE